MNNDLELIVKKYPETWPVLRVYAIGDIHVGSPEYNETATKRKLKIVEEDDNAALVLCGDLGDYGLRPGRCPTNPYKATMHPNEQQEYLTELLAPVAHKITAAVSGNHEGRLIKTTGIDPLLTICCRLGIEDVYRENMAITKYTFGTRQGPQQNVFIGLTTHGATRNKHKKFINCFDGIDFAVSGHTHTPEYSPHGKIRIDSIHATARQVAYKEIVVDANLSAGGYSIKNEYEIAPPPELQYLELSSYRLNDRNRTVHKNINYHTITI